MDDFSHILSNAQPLVNLKNCPRKIHRQLHYFPRSRAVVFKDLQEDTISLGVQKNRLIEK